MLLYILVVIHLGLIASIRGQDDSIRIYDLFGSLSAKEMQTNFYSIDDEIKWQEQTNVKLQVYYESLCPGSKSFVSTELVSTVLKLSQYLNIYLYPYGGAKTTEKDGHYEFKCQHGPLECYGNKLHACAIDILKNMTTAVLFNGCMMEPSGHNLGSDDVTADQCGKRLKIDSTPIKECAKEERGSILLKQYGDDTKRAHVKYVPYKLINGKESLGDFMAEVCEAFVIPPPICSTELLLEQLDWNEIEK